MAGAPNGTTPRTESPIDPVRNDAALPPGTECQRALVDAGVSYTRARYPPVSPEGQPQLVCGLADPVWVGGTIHGVEFVRGNDTAPTRMLASCDLAVALGRLAEHARAQGVTRVIHAGTTACRTIGGGDRLSQHAYGRAIDVLGFATRRGETWSVARDWERDVAQPRTAKGRALKAFAERMHDGFVFNVVLTPEYDAGHRDHLHMDLTPDRHYLSRGPADLLLGD